MHVCAKHVSAHAPCAYIQTEIDPYNFLTNVELLFTLTALPSFLIQLFFYVRVRPVLFLKLRMDPLYFG